MIRVEQVKNFKEYTHEEYACMVEQTNNLYAIPCDRVLSLYAELETFGNKADKLNIPYSIKEVGMVEVENIPCIILEVSFEIKVNGWQFIATIDHLKNGNIIKYGVSNVTLPTEYRQAKNTTCNHCNTTRYRKQTHVVYNATTKEYKQVGSKCLQVYTGIDVNMVFACADVINLLNDIDSIPCNSSSDLFEYGFGGVSKYINVVETVACAYDVVKVLGYANSKSDMSTSSVVADVELYLNGMLKKYNPVAYNNFKKVFANIKFLSAESIEKAKEIINYVKAQKVTNDYMNNMHVLLNEVEVLKKYRPFVVSAVAVYNKGLEQEKAYKEQHAEETTSNYIGAVGQRVTLDVIECKAVTSWENDFGVTFIYKLVDTNKNILTWKTSKVISDVKTITGTVKAHNDYKGIKQTELTRCKVA